MRRSPGTRLRMGARRVLGVRSYRLLAGACFASALGDWIVLAAAPFAVLHIGGGPAAIGALLAAVYVPRVLLVFFGGVWADRVPRHALLIASDVARALIQGAAAVLLLGDARVWQLVALAAAYGAATAFFDPALSGIVPELVDRELVQDANALLSLARSTAAIGGPAVGGALVAGSGPALAYAADAATFALSAALLAAIRVRRVGRALERASVVQDLRAGWSLLRGTPWLRATIAGAAACNLVFSPLFVLGPLACERWLGGATAWGTIASAAAAGALAGNVVALRIRPRRPVSAGFAVLAVAGAEGLLFAAAAPIPVIAAAAFAAGAAIDLSGTLWRTAVHMRVQREFVSRVAAFGLAGSMVAYPLGVSAAGPLVDAIGLRSTLWLTAALLTTTALAAALLPSIRSVVESPAEPVLVP